ncbi:double-strand break repair helicase AddA [Pelagibacterium xiamenense]|uniref:double-strand break repair helicase AddA n=1 Tax=Pelagibacterium xiamenense TaxID=2901140 RepID=UPI001E61CF45|nr:double-strand break repair helicase AddA [Pelagibacterium xiamenense]MCD7058582.1 double-strand break repair helicase AddA [Pelagibacterium xiamenense]
MSDRRIGRIPDDTKTAQARASDPTASAWVSANAGSGKTFVLTRRVLRLLLAGAAPETILCLTYTKAAAAEMRHRVAQELAKWARANDAELVAELSVVLGRNPAQGEMAGARSLFAHALETPGGLKIQTIHAFCESVLQRFPYEAGVPVNFAVMEEDERAELIRSAREAVLADGLKGTGPVAGAVARLFDTLSDTSIETAVTEALGGGRKLGAVLVDPAAAKVALRRFLRLSDTDTLEALEHDIISGMLVTPAEYDTVHAITPPGRVKQRQFEDKLCDVDRENPTSEQLFAAYLNGGGAVPRRGFPNKAIERADPDLAARLRAEAERLEAMLDRYRALTIAAQSAALIDVLSAIAQRFEADKRARSLLDFDDLIARTGALFSNPDHRDWVRYKLDAGIDHILVDESQDTNPEQWEVIDALTDDFFSGAGTGRNKTLFAVGDPKQSIYSFQGAEPALFNERGQEFGLRARQAEENWHDITLQTSFRTLDTVLDGVDEVCARPNLGAALFAGAHGIRHESARAHKGHGGIEVWPVFEEPEVTPLGADWPIAPRENLQSAARQTATAIARTIAHWVDTGAPLGPRGRAIVPEDILILVQKRTGVFGEIVRALKELNITSPGADRLPVSAHIAVDDLLGLADVLLNPADDLLLAAVLRSPLFEVTEDELFALAHGRGRGVSLFSALAKSEVPSARAAHAQLAALRARLDLDRPYAFFAHVLYAAGGLKRFHTRLGAEVDEVIAEFLDLALAHEQSDQPSLTGFVAKMRASDITIKRDLVQKAAGVRLMTVHGAKGLEAPIVFLADATGTPPAVKDCIFFSSEGGHPFLLFCPKKDDHSTASAPLREAVQARQNAEYWRNLYVAMTRAEDALYVTGPLKAKGKTEGTWYGVLSEALAAKGELSTDAVSGRDVLRFPADAMPPAPVIDPRPEERTPTTPLALGPPARRAPRTIVSPSQHDALIDVDALYNSAAESLHEARTARARGIGIHALLEHLNSVPQHLRARLAESAAATLLPGHPELAPDIATEALDILEDPALGCLFGPGARAEVSFALDGTRAGKAIRLAGRMDRIVIGDRGVLVVDYKSDAAPAPDAAHVPAPYRVQLGLYRLAAQRLFPRHTVEAAILWTANRHLMVLPEEDLHLATSSYTLT